MDEGVDIADRAVAATAERCGGLEARVRDAELAQRTGTERAQAAMGERLAEGLDKVGCRLQACGGGRGASVVPPWWLRLDSHSMLLFFSLSRLSLSHQ